MKIKSKKIIAALGPTNTGKTYYAIERMLSYNSGIIGLPLRLLAREVYDRLVKLRSFTAVALVTGEERIVPENAKFWVCTTEAMPSEKSFEFVAIDEIQLCADMERGHIFTDRLLKMRGQYETVFLGSANFWGVISKLVPEAELKSRHRFSDLKFSFLTCLYNRHICLQLKQIEVAMDFYRFFYKRQTGDQ